MTAQDIHFHNAPIDKLSGRECEAFVQLARGQSVAQISETLNLSSSAVGTHLYNINRTYANAPYFFTL
jgi:two-component system invasion response regulator UvrY